MTTGDHEASRKFSSDVVWNVAGLGLAGVCGIALNFFIGLSYGSAALGSFNQVFAAYILLSQLGSFGTQHSVLKYVAASDDPAERAHLTTSALLLGLVSSAAATLIFLAIASPMAWLLDSSETEIGMWVAAPGLFFFGLNKITLANLNGRRRMRWFAVFQGGRFVIMLAAALVLWRIGIAGAELPALISVAEAIVFLVSIVVIRTDIRRMARSVLSRLIREHARFGGKSLMSGMLIEINTRVDILMLGYFASDALVGAYSFASILAESLAQLGVVLRNNYNPILVRLLGSEKWDELSKIVRRGKRLTYLAVTSLAVIAGVVYYLAIPWFTDDPLIIASWRVFAILLAGVAVSSGFQPFQQLLIVAGLPGWHTVMITTVLAFNIVANSVLIVFWSDLGAAAATALAGLYSVFALRYFVKKKLSYRL